MGNSLLDILVFGRRAAESVKKDIPERGPLTLNNLSKFRKNRPTSSKKSPLFFPKVSKMKLEEFDKAEIKVETSSPSETSGGFEPPDPFAR